MCFSGITKFAAVVAVVLWGVAQASAQTQNQRDQNPGYQSNPSQRTDMQRTDTQRSDTQRSGTQTRNESSSSELSSNRIRSTKLVGANVQNNNGEKLGSIDDLVIDTQNGKVEYAALGVGGVLGIGEKLLAIPFEQLKISHDSSNNPYFVLNIPKDRLEKAPGFDKNKWPDFANPQWRNDVNNYYRQSSASMESGQTRPASAESSP